MFRVLRISFLVLVTIGALAAVFGIIVMVGVARLATSMPAGPTTMPGSAAVTQPATTAPSPVVPLAEASRPVVADPKNATAAGPARIALNAADARLRGSLIRRDGDTHDVIGWSRAGDWLEWPIETPPGVIHAYHVDVTYACAAGAGGDFSIEAAGQKVLVHGQPAGSWDDFRAVRLATIQVPGGKNDLAIRPVPGLQHELMRLRRVELVPVGPGDAVSMAESGRAPVVLKAEDAALHGDGIRVEQAEGSQDIGYWTKTDETAAWPIPRDRRGKFNVLLSYAADEALGGGDFELTVGGQRLTGHAQPTGNWQKYRVMNLGTVVLEPGNVGNRVVLKPTRIDDGKSFLNVRQVALVPVQ